MWLMFLMFFSFTFRLAVIACSLNYLIGLMLLLLGCYGHVCTYDGTDALGDDAVAGVEARCYDECVTVVVGLYGNLGGHSDVAVVEGVDIAQILHLVCGFLGNYECALGVARHDDLAGVAATEHAVGVVEQSS